MKNHLKYLISLLLAFVVIASDGTLNIQSKSAAYYQSSKVVAGRELDSKNFRLYQYKQAKSLGNISFSIFIILLSFSTVFSFRAKALFKLFKLLHQIIHSFIKQSVFVNEVINSANFRTGLYGA